MEIMRAEDQKSWRGLESSLHCMWVAAEDKDDEEEKSQIQHVKRDSALMTAVQKGAVRSRSLREALSDQQL